MAQPQEHVQQLVDHLFRHEAGRMAAVLTRLLGTENLDIAEDLVQDTLLKAIEIWRFRGVPDNPSAWLYKVAHNKAIDWVRSGQRQSKILSAQQENIKSIWDLSSSNDQLFSEDEIQDSVLRMMFACCHPAITPESQIALTLKTLGGLSVAEIANAFLTSDETIAKRIYRAKEKIRQENIKLDPPGLFELPYRLDSVLQVLYLLFNEGYHSRHHDKIIREDLCEEAMRLTYLLAMHKATSLPKVKALMALMCLQSSRFDARTGELGEIILLEDQDRSQWSQPLIQQGLDFLEKASVGSSLSGYHVEAAIASVHSLASRFEETQWDKLLTLYQTLHELKPGPIVSLNKAIATGYAHSFAAGIQELKKITDLQNHSLYLTALGNFHLLESNTPVAKEFLEKALAKASSSQEAELIKRKLQKCL
ncbi:MAG: sigma-70 family RNA polymerase sigma factor [Cyclobacteriaceae bacterium]